MPVPDAQARSSERELAAPLSDEQIESLMPSGDVHHVTVGDVLFREGDASYAFFVILSGRVAVVDGYGGAERELADGVRGEFVAELNIFTGERLYTTAVVRESGAVLSVPREASSNSSARIRGSASSLCRQYSRVGNG
jgi:thioredoxin reductase (NADPH)